MESRERVARWLWDFLEESWAEVDRRKPVTWDDFKNTDGFDADWWRDMADELLALLSEPSREREVALHIRRTGTNVGRCYRKLKAIDPALSEVTEAMWLRLEEWADAILGEEARGA